MASSQYPPGIGFYPKDYELIEHYLVKKVKGCYCYEDYGVVTETDVFEYEPDHLVQLANYRAGGSDGSFYFFAPLKPKDRNGKNAKRSRDGGGTWESSAKIVKIKNKDKQFIIGERRLLVYKIRVGEKLIATPWRIHEYRLEGDYKCVSSSARKGKSSQYLDFVLCRLSLSTREPGSIAQVAPEKEGKFEQQDQQASCSYRVQQQHLPPLQGSSIFYGSAPHQSSYQQSLQPSSNLIPLSTNGFDALLSQQSIPEAKDDDFAMQLEDILESGDATS